MAVIWIVAVVLIVAAGLFSYLAIMADKPMYFRKKEVAVLKELAWGLALRYGEGSSLVMGYGERSDLIEILKGPDTGEIPQEVRLKVASAMLLPQERRAVLEALSGNGMALVESWDDATSMTCMETVIRGTPEEIGADAHKIAQAIVTGLRLSSDQRFTFKLSGDMDHRVWRRMNQDTPEE